MIILFEIELLLILAGAGWFQNRWLFLLFVSGEVFLAAWFVISLVSSFILKVSVRTYEGEVRLSHTAMVRIGLSHKALIRNKIRIHSHLILPTGEKKKFTYKAFFNDSDLSLPVPALVIGENRFIIDRVSFSDAAGIFFFSKRIKKSTIIPVVPDPALHIKIENDETEKDFLQKNIIIEKGKDISHDEIRSFREYRHGDEKRDIHWNISARLGKYYVKEYEGRSDEKVTGTERKNGHETVTGNKVTVRTKTDYNLKKVRYQSGIRRKNKTLFSTLLRGILAAGIVLTLLLQMTLFGHPFRFEAVYPVAAILVTAASLTVSAVSGRFRKILPITLLLLAAIITATHISAVSKGINVFVRWLSGSYKYTDSTPYTDLTPELVISAIVLTVIFFEVLQYRGMAAVLFAMAAAVYVARDTLDADSESISGIMLCVIAVGGLAFIVLSNTGIDDRKRFRLYLKETDTGHLAGIATGVASLILGIVVAGILPDIAGNQYSGSDVLSGRYADNTMNSIYDAENNGIERIAQLYKINYRVPFDGRVGQQLNQFTGETQLVVSYNSREAGSRPDDDLYLRFYTGRKYDKGNWSGDEPEELMDKSIDEAAEKLGITDEEKERRKNSGTDYLNSGIYTYLQYQHNMYNGYGLSFYSYEIRNAKPKGYTGSGLSYDLSKVSVPLGYSGGAIQVNSDYPMFAVVPSLYSCSYDVSDVQNAIEEIGKLQSGYSDSENNSLGNEARTSGFAAAVVDAYGNNYADYYLDVPEKGLNMTRQLVKDQPLDDIEEITAYIRYILASHATYSLTARDPVGNTDPVEYFLFSSHKGYCEQFASAACLLYRMYGIPARYVSGYRVTPSDYGKDNTAYVPDSSAHAWVEIYLPSTGWLPVEMTPSNIPENAGSEVTGYPKDSDKMIWPEFSEGDLLRIQEEKEWTGRIFRTKMSSTTEGSAQTQASEEQKKTVEQQASADADDSGRTVTTDKKSGIDDLFEKYRTAFIFICIALAAFICVMLIRRAIDYRFRHAGLMAIAVRTDRVITRAGNFVIPLSADQSEKFTRYFRLLDKAQYSGYKGTPQEVEWAYCTYDEFLTLFSNKLILSKH